MKEVANDKLYATIDADNTEAVKSICLYFCLSEMGLLFANLAN